MKKNLTFIPLGIGVSAAIIYIFNILKFRVINNSATLFQILSNLKIYLYISIIGFVTYFLINILTVLKNKKSSESLIEKDYKEKEYNDLNYYNENKNYEEIELHNSLNQNDTIKEIIIPGNKYCFNCGEKIFDTDSFCRNCGKYQKEIKKNNPILKNIINVLEIVILVLIIYFSLNLLFEYKESKDPNFKSPFNVYMTK